MTNPDTERGPNLRADASQSLADADAARVRGDMVTPILVKCQHGAWLATSPKYARFQIGVFGATEAEAIENFQLSYAKWTANGPNLTDADALAAARAASEGTEP